MVNHIVVIFGEFFVLLSLLSCEMFKHSHRLNDTIYPLFGVEKFPGKQRIGIFDLEVGRVDAG